MTLESRRRRIRPVARRFFHDGRGAATRTAQLVATMLSPAAAIGRRFLGMETFSD
jgi:hypothetical protein